MNLRLIEGHDFCDVCGCSAMEERIAEEETDSGPEEVNYRKFRCGKEIKSGKNKSLPNVIFPCSREEELRIKEEKRIAAKQTLSDFCNSLDVDKSFKNSVCIAISRIGNK